MLIWAVLANGVASASDLDQVKKELVGKTVLIRGLYTGDVLTFDGAGNVIGAPPVGGWTVAQVEVKNAEKEHGQLVIHGIWVGMEVTPDGVLKPVYQGIREKNETTTSKPDWVKIVIAERDSKKWDTEVNKVFVIDRAKWIDAIPESWHDYLNKKFEQSETPDSRGILRVLRDGTEVYKCRGTIRKPKAIDTPDPEYSEPARRAKYIGDGDYSIVVDSQGRPRDIRVKKPAGLGLDEIAIGALQNWRFQPAQKDGSPVAAELEISMTWRAY